MLILDMRTSAFTPLNDIKNHLVYCENGSSIEKVIVNGEIVCRRRQAHACRRGGDPRRAARADAGFIAKHARSRS